MSLLELYNACKKGDVARIRKDVADGYDVRKVVDKYWFNDTPLHCACEYVYQFIGVWLAWFVIINRTIGLPKGIVCRL